MAGNEGLSAYIKRVRGCEEWNRRVKTREREGTR